MFIGSHMPKQKGGVLETLLGLHETGITACQVFLSSPLGKPSAKTWAALENEAPQVKKYIGAQNLRCFTHLPYTINLAREDAPLEGILKELEICHKMGFVGCVVHVGKSVKLSKDTGLQNMYDSFVRIADFLKANRYQSKIILETAAGQGTELLVDLQSFAGFYNRFTAEQKAHIGLCVDTAHIWAAGTELATYMADFDRMIGLRHCTVVHFNNSKVAWNSRVDRHESLEAGKIPIESLTAIARQAASMDIPLVLETPLGPLDVPVLAQMLGKQVPKMNLLQMVFYKFNF